MYPIILNVEDRLCTIVGGGKIAFRKANRLYKNGAKIRVISPSICTDFEEIEFEHIKDKYDKEYILGSFIVIAATDDVNINSQIVIDSKQAGIIVSSATKDLGADFISPAIADLGNVKISVSTGGNFPKLSVKICNKIKEDYAIYARLSEVLDKYRKIAFMRISDREVTNKLFDYFISDENIEFFKENGIDKFEKLVSDKIDEAVGGNSE